MPNKQPSKINYRKIAAISSLGLIFLYRHRGVFHLQLKKEKEDGERTESHVRIGVGFALSIVDDISG